MIIQGHDCYLVDDGTLDTVIEVDGKEFRFDGEYASFARDMSGAITDKGFIELCQECIEEMWLNDPPGKSIIDNT